MKNFHHLSSGANVLPLMHATVRQPDLWNAHRFRTTFPQTPHADVDDIWLRFSPDPGSIAEVINDAKPVWHEAWQRLPQARGLVSDLMRMVEGYELCRLIITRLRPGGRILPHADDQGDYVHLGDIVRYHLVLQGLPGSLFRCGDETVCMRTGELWSFNAHVEHEVANNSTDDRVHLLADIRICP